MHRRQPSVAEAPTSHPGFLLSRVRNGKSKNAHWRGSHYQARSASAGRKSGQSKGAQFSSRVLIRRRCVGHPASVCPQKNRQLALAFPAKMPFLGVRRRDRRGRKGADAQDREAAEREHVVVPGDQGPPFWQCRPQDPATALLEPLRPGSATSFFLVSKTEDRGGGVAARSFLGSKLRAPAGSPLSHEPRLPRRPAEVANLIADDGFPHERARGSPAPKAVGPVCGRAAAG